MTVVVYRDGILAADSRLTARHYIDTDDAQKVFKLSDGSLLGVAGAWASACCLIDIMKKTAEGKKKKDLPTVRIKGIDAIFVDGDRTWFYESGIWWRTKRPYMTIGDGWREATGALEMGATAVEAVRAAIKWNAVCGGRVRKVSL